MIKRCGCGNEAKPSTTGIYCDLGALGRGGKDEHIERSRRLLRSATTVEWRDAGVTLTLPRVPTVVTDAASWMHDESRCCPFLTFTLRVSPGLDGIELIVDEPDGAHGFLRSELEALGVFRR